MKNLDDLLESWSVLPPGHWDNDDGPKGWFAVCNDEESIVAYFSKEEDAFRYRLDQINLQLNTIPHVKFTSFKKRGIHNEDHS